jgi:hypothetical protein
MLISDGPLSEKEKIKQTRIESHLQFRDYLDESLE